ncbi:L-rhamnose mutarotase [Chitinophaga agrisoli]|uniref:L-rhamnose mutarotase n=1 Tax=Chitinophaga agrisoli TaxID=2607653 RepID=A0A5B2VLK3_9BACT|nr:L-rhamnose mutarotase [Chitinophaga agrisoli]KAA2239202.1 L-rhamnose mutarotase [Chitinophaga agrisoli]
MKTAFKMHLKPGCKEEYRSRHAAIWPELKQLLTQNGIADYTIFLDESTNTLFAVQHQSNNSSSQDLGADPIVQRWWAYMSDLMLTNPDNSPISEPLEQVFHMD